MTQTSFMVDERVAQQLEKLKKEFGVASNAQVIRKALTLSLIAAENATRDHAVTLVGEDGHKIKVMLTG